VRQNLGGLTPRIHVDPWGLPEELARQIQKRLEVELGLSASIGLAANKLVAKIASGLEKPRGFVVVPHGKEAEFLSLLPVEKLWGVGEVTAKSLHEMGVFTIGQLALLPTAQLETKFGRRGRDLHRQARGIDDSPVVVEREEKSLSREITFAQDIGDRRVLRKTLLSLSEDVARRLRKRGLRGRTVKLKLRYADFTTLTSPTSTFYLPLLRFFSILAQVSRNDTVRLNTSFPSAESGSTQK